jgi:pantothenate kinase
MTDEWDEKTEIMNQSVMIEHKKKLIKAKEEKNTENVIEVLLSLRVNALQISPDLRKNLVYELIRNDILCIEETKDNSFVLDLLSIHAYNLRHATLSLISIISATYKGVEYLMLNSSTIVEKIIEVIILLI